MLTDGIAGLPNDLFSQLQEVKKKKNVKIYTIIIGSNVREVRFSDENFNIND